MKAVGLSTFGGPEVLRVFEVPEPHAGPGEVRVRVHAATVNPGDRDMRVGAVPLAASGPPYIPGMEAAGVLDEMGEGADADLRIGDRVMAMIMPNRREGGAYAEYVVLPAQHVVRAPAHASHAQAATVPMNGLTARLALDLLALSPGQTLAVTGAAGGFGGYVVQLAKTDGLRVVADASPADEKLIRSLGADLVVARGGDAARNFLDAVPQGADGLADGASLGVFRLVGAVRDGGSMAAVRGEGPDARGESEIRARAIRSHMVYVPDYFGDRNRLDTLRRTAESGALTMRVARTFPPEQAAEAHRLLEAGGFRGRLILEF